MTNEPLVWVDRDYDRRKAYPGTSRYANYLERNAELFAGASRTEHAISAWYVATSPIMSPGYARSRADLEKVVLERDDDGNLVAVVELRLPNRRVTADAGIGGMADWWMERPWSESLDSPHYAYCDPRPGRPALLLTARLVLPVSMTGLAEPDGDGPDVELAMRTCERMAAEINRAAAPAVNALRSAR